MACTKARPGRLPFVLEEDDCEMDRSSTDANSGCSPSRLIAPVSPEFTDEGWDLGFSSPFRDCMSDESPEKSKMSGCTTPPLSPPSLGALRLFDSPQTPKSLLERSSNVNRTMDFKRPVSRLRRGLLKGRGFESEPRMGPRSRQVTANVNPFTPDSAIGAKRARQGEGRLVSDFLFKERCKNCICFFYDCCGSSRSYYTIRFAS